MNYHEPVLLQEAIESLKVEKEKLYYHQIFFHYVLADGLRANCAGDR